MRISLKRQKSGDDTLTVVGTTADLTLLRSGAPDRTVVLETGAADDNMVLKGDLVLPDAVAAFDAADPSPLVDTAEAGLVANVRVPAGAMHADRPGTKLKF